MLGGICMGVWFTVTGNQSFAFKAKRYPHPRTPAVTKAAVKGDGAI